MSESASDLIAYLCLCGAGLCFLLLAACMLRRLRSDARRDRYYRSYGSER